MPDQKDRRVFLGFDNPPLVSAVEWLIQNHQFEKSGRHRLDLSDFLIVVPTLRAQARLLQLLIAQTEQAGILFSPPIITSLGQLPEYLYVAEKSLANDLAQQIAWSMALAEAPDEEIRCLTGRPEVDDLQDWQPLASVISKLHQRLANDIWSFRSVAREVEKETGFLKEEIQRWRALNSIQQRYYTILHSVELWDRQAARNFAAAGLLKADPPEIRCSTDKHIVMLGTADLNRSVSEMLRQVIYANPDQVSILVAAPPSMADRFDSFGSLITDAWLNLPIPIDDQQILIANQPADQAYAATWFLSNLDQPVAADEITIGVPDESVVPQLERMLNAIDLPHRNLAGRRLAETAPVRLMIACRDYLHAPTFESLSSLVRHPDLFRWLCEQVQSSSWLNELSEFQRCNLPSIIELDAVHPFGNPDRLQQLCDPGDEKSVNHAQRCAETAQRLNLVHAAIARLLGPLDEEEQPIFHWTRRWSDVLVTVYEDRLMDKTNPSDLQTIVACQSIFDALANQREVPAEFETTTSARQALDWALEAAAERRVVVPPIPDAVEFAGWLDLALDDAPVMAITGMNDENVPSSEIGHPFLPNELCKKLQILDNDRRYARDAYALTVITSVRDQLMLIAGRRDELGEPLKPSRLLFADSDDVAAVRAKAFFTYTGKPDSQFWLANETHCHDSQQFEVPCPTNPSVPDRLSVTRFRDYLKCPYRYYLQYVLNLKTVDDQWRELDGGMFGDLTHNVLEAFGLDPVNESDDVEEIYSFLNNTMDELVEQKFGGSRLPAVRIQIEQLRLRLEKFAVAQARRRSEGWRIVSTEETLCHHWDVDGDPFLIRGKIDRVDRHEQTGQIAVWDYKSSDKGEHPETVHYFKRDKKWKDLQLPLYRHLVKEVSAVAGADFDNLILGYILLPKNLDDVGFFAVNWDAELLATADETARDVIRQLRKGIFWPPAIQPPRYSEDLAGICQDHVFEKFTPNEMDAGAFAEEAPW